MMTTKRMMTATTMQICEIQLAMHRQTKGGCNTYAHLHVLPPHLLADTVGTTTETLGGHGQVVGLILQRIEALAALRNLVDVVAHDANGVVNLLCRELAKRARGLS